MRDYIKREDAHALFCQFCKGSYICVHNGVCNAEKALANIPAADVVERKVGHWDDGVSFYLRCSECGCCLKQPSEYNDVFLDIGRANYCPNCGARMEANHGK